MNRIKSIAVLGLVLALMLGIGAGVANAQAIPNSNGQQSVTFSGSVSESLTLSATGAGPNSLSYDGTNFWTSIPATVTATYNANNRQALAVYSGIISATGNFNLAAWQEKVQVGTGTFGSYVTCNQSAGTFPGGGNVINPGNSALPGGGTSACSQTFVAGSNSAHAGAVTGTGTATATYVYQYAMPNAASGNYSVTVAYVAYLF